MATMGLREEAVGHWSSKDGLKEIVDYDGGIMLVTRIYPDRPEFDIRTMHPDNGQHRDIDFLNSCLKEHIGEILSNTEKLKKEGLAAFKPSVKS